MAMEWTPKRISTLIALWDEGITTTEIGRRLGITKNAVVGKVHRLGLAKRRASTQTRKAAETSEIISLGRLGAGMCSWPEGDPRKDDLRFCGQKTVTGRPYCAEHCAKAYVRNTKSEKKAAAA